MKWKSTRNQTYTHWTRSNTKNTCSLNEALFSADGFWWAEVHVVKHKNTTKKNDDHDDDLQRRIYLF